MIYFRHPFKVIRPAEERLAIVRAVSVLAGLRESDGRENLLLDALHRIGAPGVRTTLEQLAAPSATLADRSLLYWCARYEKIDVGLDLLLQKGRQVELASPFKESGPSTWVLVIRAEVGIKESLSHEGLICYTTAQEALEEPIAAE